MDVLIGLAITLLAAALTPWFSSLLAHRIAAGAARQRREDAYARLTADPLVAPDAKIAVLYIDGAGGFSEVMRDCRISGLKEGMVEITDAEGRKLNMTGQEFEKMWPVFASEG